jgi:hypothetical protein
MLTKSPSMKSKFLFGVMSSVLAALVLTYPAAGADDATAIRFIVGHADCKRSIDPQATFELFVDGTSLGVFPSSNGCTCNATPLVVTTTDPAILALVGPVGCLRVGLHLEDPKIQLALAYVRVEIDRTESGTEEVCLFDYAAVSCADRNICAGLSASPGFAFPGTSDYSYSPPDTDGDGDPDCSDPDNIPNRPPVCTAAYANPCELWLPNQQFVPISILGVTDPDEDTVTITIDSIYQDEAVNAKGSGMTAPDGQGVGSSTAKIRAERVGGSNGRVYHIGFTADDGKGESCAGEVLVGVPHDQGQGVIPVDDGAKYNSTLSP